MDGSLIFNRYFPFLLSLMLVCKTLQKHSDCKEGKSALDLYFLQDDGSSFKATVFFEPYFYLMTRVCLLLLSLWFFLSHIFQPDSIDNVQEYLLRKYNKILLSVAKVSKQDLSVVCFVFESSLQSRHKDKPLGRCRHYRAQTHLSQCPALGDMQT